jgi:hypothetical protein
MKGDLSGGYCPSLDNSEGRTQSCCLCEHTYPRDTDAAEDMRARQDGSILGAAIQAPFAEDLVANSAARRVVWL